MKSEEKKVLSNLNDISSNSTNPINSNISQNYYFKNKNKTIATKNNTKYILNNPILRKFNFQKQKTDYKLKSISNSTKKNKLPLLTFNSISFYDSINSDNLNNLDIDSLKKKLISNKSNINKKRTELQDLKIQYNKLIDENKNHKNLIYEILNLENEPNSSSIEIEENNINISPMGRITEEQLISKINSCKIDEQQEKRLKDSYELINLRMELNNKKKLLLDKNHEYDTLKHGLKFKNMNEITTKLEDLFIEEERIKKDNEKLEEILKKNTSEILPNMEKEFETEKKNYEEINKKEIEHKKTFNNKLHQLNELKTEIQNIENKTKSKKNKNKNLDGLEYKGSKTIGIQLKARIEKMKFQINQINKYKNEKRDDMTKEVAERKSKIDEQKKKNTEIENKIKEISDKNKELFMKNLEYEEEKNKEIKKMKDTEDKLNNVKNKKNELIKEIEEKEKILEKNKKEQNDKNKNVLEQLNSMENNIQNTKKQVEELKGKISEIQKNIDKYQEQIDNKKKEIEKLKDETNNKNNEEENAENNKEENKEDEESVKKNLIKENKKYKKENEKIKNDINILEEQIKKYINMNSRLNKKK